MLFWLFQPNSAKRLIWQLFQPEWTPCPPPPFINFSMLEWQRPMSVMSERSFLSYMFEKIPCHCIHVLIALTSYTMRKPTNFHSYFVRMVL